MAAGSVPAAERAEPVKLSLNAQTHCYDFETATVAGSIRPEGAYHGVSRLIHKATGKQVIDSRYSALNLFRLFSVNLGLGTPRAWPREVKASDTAVEIFWPETDAHQGTIHARYEVREPGDVDLTLSFKSLGTYAGYEILLPSYFDQSMIPHLYLKRRDIGSQPPELDLVVPTVSDVFRGCGLVFPRDAHTARFPVDGRWNRSEYKMDVAPFVPLRHYGHSFMFMTDPQKKLAAVLMMHRESCSAISARYYSEKPEDRLTSYSAMDFLVFGRNFAPGEEATAHIRLSLTDLDATLSQPLLLHQRFLAETSSTKDAGSR
jgi:hypothetical protein